MKNLVFLILFSTLVWLDHPFVGRVVNDKLRSDISEYIVKMEKSGYRLLMAPDNSGKWLWRRVR